MGLLFPPNKKLIDGKGDMTYQKAIGIELGKPDFRRPGVETNLDKKAFWIGFEKRAMEFSDTYTDAFFRPDRKAPAKFDDWGVKLNTDMDARDIGEGQALMFGQNSPQTDVYTGQGNFR